MKTSKIEFDKVELPITKELINNLGNEFGNSFYIIKTLYKSKQVYIKDDKTVGEKDVDYYHTRILKINQCANGYLGEIDGQFYYGYKKELITEICKLEF